LIDDEFCKDIVGTAQLPHCLNSRTVRRGDWCAELRELLRTIEELL
jgi:hypothetical protein